MALDEQAKQYRSLDDWFKTAQGAHVGAALTEELHAVAGCFNGGILLQLGNCGDNVWLNSLRLRHKLIVAPYLKLHQCAVTSSLNALPFDRNSVDCVFAPFALEILPQHKNPLDEIDRVLKPMGHVIFFGVNPASIWGGALKLGLAPCLGHHSATLISSFSIKRTLLARGYQQCLHSSFYYVPPVRQEAWLRRLAVLNLMGKMVWPFPAGFYCLVLQKYQPDRIMVAPSFALSRGL